MSASNHHPIASLQDLAAKTDVSLSLLQAIVERRVDSYREFKLTKANGSGLRSISSPDPQLEKVQRWILKNILLSAPVHARSHAYIKGRSIKTCAEVHSGARWLVKLDLQNFFHHVDESQVAVVFNEIGYDLELSRQLAQLCTRKSSRKSREVPKYKALRRARGSFEEYDCRSLGYLPQGAPTSGMLANLVAQSMDEGLSGIAFGKYMRYTRYADDLTFSSKERFSRPQALQIIRSSRSEVAAHGFVLNERKIRITPPGSRLTVLGLLVDQEQVHLSAKFKKKLRWHVYGVSKFGIVDYSMSQGFASVSSYMVHVDGLFHHAMDVERHWACELYAKWLSVTGRIDLSSGAQVPTAAVTSGRI